MKKVLLALVLAWATAGFGHLECGQVVAGMGATLGDAPTQDLVTLLKGAQAKNLPVSVRYKTRFTGAVKTVRAFVTPYQSPHWESVGFNLLTDDGIVFARQTNLLDVRVLPAPVEPTLDTDERQALDRLRDAWERRRPVRLFLVERDTGLFTSWLDAAEEIQVQAVRLSVDGEWLVDYQRLDWGIPARGTWRFAAINPVTVRYY